MELRRQLALNTDNLLSTLTGKLVPNVMACIPFDLVGTAEMGLGACCMGHPRRLYIIAEAYTMVS